MKKSLLYSFLFLFSFAVFSQANCNDAFSAANYSVAHTSKAYESTNTDHVQEWSEKAIETFLEVEGITADCGCQKAADYAYEGNVAATKCQEQNTWERSRFYAKRAREKAGLMMDALSKCTNVPVSKIYENDEYSDGGVLESSNDTNNDLESQKRELLAQQQELIEQQKKIQKQLAAQKNLQEKLERERLLELQQQKTIKVNAEIALGEIQKNMNKLVTTYGCSKLEKIYVANYLRSVDALNKENLTDTKIFYTSKLNEMTEKYLLFFAKCLEE